MKTRDSAQGKYGSKKDNIIETDHQQTSGSWAANNLTSNKLVASCAVFAGMYWFVPFVFEMSGLTYMFDGGIFRVGIPLAVAYYLVWQK